MIELHHMDVRHFVNMECSHLANGCTTKCVCIDLMLFPYLSCLGAIICDKDTIGFVSVCISAQFVTLCHGCGKLCNRSPGGREPKWMVHVKRPCDVAKRYTSSGLTICCHDDTGVHDGSDGSNRVDRGNPQEYGEDLRCPLLQREWGGEGKGGGSELCQNAEGECRFYGFDQHFYYSGIQGFTMQQHLFCLIWGRLTMPSTAP